MTDNLTKLYVQRLESFSHTLNYLHEIVGADEALALLKDERLVQYKLDRIGELVREVIVSQKQRIIIQLIQKIQAMQSQINAKQPKRQEIDESQLVYYRKRLQQKNYDIERLKTEANILKQQRDQNKRVCNQLKIQFQIYQNKYKQIKQKWDSLEQLKTFEVKTNIQNIETYVEKITNLQKMLQQQKIQNQQSILSKQGMIKVLKLEIESLTNKLNENKLLSGRQKSETVDFLKKQVRRLGNQLNQMKEMIKIILSYINQSLSAQLKGIKKEISDLCKYITKEMNSMLLQLSKSYNQFIGSDKIRINEKYDEQLVKRMQNLQGQLNKFIEVNKI